MPAFTRVLFAAFLALVAAIPAKAQCTLEWSPDFGRPTFTSGGPQRLATIDLGSGPALYAGGSFTTIGGVTTTGIARWNGNQWSTVGGGLGGLSTATCMLAYDDDGPGPHPLSLFVGGTINVLGGSGAKNIARWDGTNWFALGGIPGNTNGSVNAMAVFDDGTGPALYAGGGFTNIGGTFASGIARWKNGGWSALGTGINVTVLNSVKTLCVFDDGSGPALYVGGNFSTAGGQPASSFARWSAAGWSTLPSSPSGGANGTSILALQPFDDGSGPALYVGGYFTTAGGGPAVGIARWDGTQFSGVGGGITGAVPQINDLTVFDDGTGGGAALYATGTIATAGGQPASNIAKWDGVQWSALGGGVSASANTFAIFDRGDGAGPGLYVGGTFSYANGNSGSVDRIPALSIARWQAGAWSALGNGITDTSLTFVLANAVYDFGTGPELYAGGQFGRAGDQACARSAKWNGKRWLNLTSGTDGNVNAIAPYAGKLYFGGTFGTAGGLPISNIASWNGSAWASVTTGTATFTNVTCLHHFTGFGDRLYIAGRYNAGGGNFPIGVLELNGNLVFNPATAINDYPLAMLGVTEPSGPALYIGGLFHPAGLSYIARYNGSTTSGVGGGMNGQVNALAQFDDGSGPAIYAAGQFTVAGGVAANGIAKWNGSVWSALGSGLNAGAIPHALAVFDDGSGPALYVGGTFSSAGGVGAHGVARWKDSTWSVIDVNAVPGDVRTLTVYDDGLGGGPALFVGGSFDSAGTRQSVSIAKWSDTHRGPTIITDPSSVTANAGDLVHFDVLAVGNNLTYQWRKDGVDLANGPTGTGSSIINATFQQVLIINIGADDGGVYDCVVSNDCLPVATAGATLTVNVPPPPCYANCDESTVPPLLNANDFQCFLNAFATGDPYANCDGSTILPVLNANDFQCFLNAFANGCP